jgi:hypothetical protein
MLLSLTRSWQTQIPATPKNKHIKRCYSVWTHIERWIITGGKIVWLTDAELILAQIKYPKKEFVLILERDKLEEYKKYLDATIE